MKIDILTLFPKMFKGPFEDSIIQKAQEKGLVEIQINDLRNWADDKHNKVDDKPYGGGPGMVIKVNVVDKALTDIKSKSGSEKYRPSTIMLSPQGEKYTQSKAKQLSKIDHLILVAGHYEGFDERIRIHLIDEEISIGDYVLTGGEIPAMVVTDSVIRLLPGVLGDQNSLVDETHSKPGKIKHPVYTRPEEYRGWKVPEILLSGDHPKIEKWRQDRTKRRES